MNFSDFQERANATDKASRAPWIGLTEHVYALTEKIGSINGCLKKKVREKKTYKDDTFKEDLERYIGDALWYLTAICTHLNLNLESIANKNLDDNSTRWGTPATPQRHLFTKNVDERFPEDQRLPKVFTAKFQSEEGPNDTSWLPIVEVLVEGKPFGNKIDDNRRTADGYRYHDILHIAFATYLGWSPVLRKLLQKKRKADKKIDKFDDGARAVDTEEAVSNFIHHEARRNSYWAGAKYIETSFLVKILAMVEGLEVDSRTPAEWQHCIIEAYKIFGKLAKNGGGYVDANLVEQRLNFRKG